MEDPNPDKHYDLQAIGLRFARFTCHLVRKAEADQVEILIDEDAPWPDTMITDISNDLPWREIIDRYFLTDLWKMINHNGYHDAAQFRFISVDRKYTSEHVVQFEAVASGFSIYRLDLKDWGYNPVAHLADE